MKFIIEKAAAQRLLDYLAKRPFDEVFELIPLLMGLESFADAEKEKASIKVADEIVHNRRPDRKRPA